MQITIIKKIKTILYKDYGKSGLDYTILVIKNTV